MITNTIFVTQIPVATAFITPNITFIYTANAPCLTVVQYKDGAAVPDVRSVTLTECETIFSIILTSLIIATYINLFNQILNYQNYHNLSV